MILYTYDEGKAKKVMAGKLKDGVYRRNVEKKHFMIKENGYGIQTDVITRLLSAGCDKVILSYKSSLYISDFRDWLLNGNRNNHGHGEQIFLDKSYYKVIKGGEK